jgi:hypothetical protein
MEEVGVSQRVSGQIQMQRWGTFRIAGMVQQAAGSGKSCGAFLGVRVPPCGWGAFALVWNPV